MVVGAVVTYFMANVKTSVFISLFLMGVIATAVFAYLGNYILKK
jgi:small basic protein